MYKTLFFWWCPIGGNWVVVTRTAVLRLYLPSITPWGHFLLKYKFLLQRNCHWWAISIKLNSTAGLKKSRCIHNFVTYKSNLYSRRWNIKTLIASTFSNSSMQKYTRYNVQDSEQRKNEFDQNLLLFSEKEGLSKPEARKHETHTSLIQSGERSSLKIPRYTNCCLSTIFFPDQTLCRMHLALYKQINWIGRIHFE